MWDCGPDSHQQRFILVPRDYSFLNSGVQPQLYHTYHALLHSIWIFFFFFFLLLREDKLLGSDLRSVSGVKRFRPFPTLDRQSVACAAQLHWQGGMKTNMFRKYTEQEQYWGEKKGGNPKRGQPHIHWLQKQCKGLFITCLMWLSDMEACVHKGFFHVKINIKPNAK